MEGRRCTPNELTTASDLAFLLNYAARVSIFKVSFARKCSFNLMSRAIFPSSFSPPSTVIESFNSSIETFFFLFSSRIISRTTLTRLHGFGGDLASCIEPVARTVSETCFALKARFMRPFDTTRLCNNGGATFLD